MPEPFPFTLHQGFLVGPEDAPDEVIDAKEYRRAMLALTEADAAFKRLFKVADHVVLQIQVNTGMGNDEAEELGLHELDDLLEELRPLAE